MFMQKYHLDLYSFMQKDLIIKRWYRITISLEVVINFFFSQQKMSINCSLRLIKIQLTYIIADQDCKYPGIIQLVKKVH